MATRILCLICEVAIKGKNAAEARHLLEVHRKLHKH